MQHDAVDLMRERMLDLTPFDVFGHRVTLVRSRGPMLPRPRSWPLIGVRLDVLRGTWELWREFYEPVARRVVRDWDGLTYDDLWRDPEVGLRFCRAMAGVVRG